MTIFLIGMMGSGKTTVGKELASQLNLKFIDSDYLIENKEGLTIKEIFKSKGETYFRHLESKVLQDIIESEEDCVIACGGGLPIHKNNLVDCLENGKVFYLKAPSEVLFERIYSDHTRPMLKDFENFKQLLLHRDSFYEKAHFIIDGTKNTKEICTEILGKLFF